MMFNFRLLTGVFSLFCVVLAGCDVSKGTSKGAVIDAYDPITVDFPIAYVSRPLPVDENGMPVADDIFMLAAFNPGAQLIIKDRAIASARETIITKDIFPADAEGNPPLYDVKDLEVSPDGLKLLFALRAPEIEGLDDDEQPTWNIWEFHRADNVLRPIITSSTQAEQGHDISPRYMDDGRIVFSSTRQRRTRAILLDDGKSQYPGLDDKRDNEAFLLHVMNDDGTDIKQISYNASHDIQPSVLSTSELVYLRWDAINGRDELSLYKSNPDGTNAELYYGYHSQNTGTNNSEGVITRIRELEDGRLMAILRPRETFSLGGDIIAIDAANFVDIDTPTTANSGATGPAQVSLTLNEVDTEGTQPSPAGYFNAAYPLYDGTNRLLVSWAQCRLVDPITEAIVPCTDRLLNENAEPAPLLYSLWVYSTDTGTQLPVKTPVDGIMYSDAVAMSPYTQPAFFTPNTSNNAELIAEGVGILHIRSVYDFDGVDTTDDGIEVIRDPATTPPDERPARFVRIVKAVPIPDDNVLDFDNAAFGVSNNQLMREILGYVPIEPDGSVKFKLPADVSVMLDLVDATGKRLGGRHQNWLSLRPGEERECSGCHTRNSEAPHGRQDAQAPTANLGAVGGIAFPSTLLLTDATGSTSTPAVAGESMAEYYARVRGPRTPTVDIQYTDEWTDPAAASVGTDINYRYIDLNSSLNTNPADFNCAPLEIEPPRWIPPTSCLTTGSWNSKCRITINYQESIHPIWESDRRTCDIGGNVISNNTCTACHSRGTADLLQLPAGQLELTGETSIDRNDFITSYAELLFDDTQQALVGTSLANVVIEIDTGEIERDAAGNIILDDMGNPIPILLQEPVIVDRAMSQNGAMASNRFFDLFITGGSHAGYLTGAELKLIAEWLDIGAQYYNDPFDAPAD